MVDGWWQFVAGRENDPCKRWLTGRDVLVRTWMSPWTDQSDDAYEAFCCSNTRIMVAQVTGTNLVLGMLSAGMDGVRAKSKGFRPAKFELVELFRHFNC
jgi:hypothetical protein